MRAVFVFLLTIPLFAINITPKNYSGKIVFLKQEILNFNFGCCAFSEISDLVYDKKGSILYMVSDEGILYSFKAYFTPQSYSLKPLNAYILKNRKGKKLKGSKSDSEGLALSSSGRLYISFEGRHPKIAEFSKKGVKIKTLPLPKILKKAKVRSKNKGFEALAYHSRYGLLTALEFPKKGDKKRDQTIYSLSGNMWHLKMEPVKNSAIVEIEVMDDGNLLILERAYNGIFGKFEINLVKFYIQGCKSGTYCKKELLLKIDSAKGWQVENFEGLARVGKNRYLMVSDDNGSLFASTLLIYFKVKE